METQETLSAKTPRELNLLVAQAYGWKVISDDLLHKVLSDSQMKPEKLIVDYGMKVSLWDEDYNTTVHRPSEDLGQAMDFAQFVLNSCKGDFVGWEIDGDKHHPGASFSWNDNPHIGTAFVQVEKPATSEKMARALTIATLLAIQAGGSDDTAR